MTALLLVVTLLVPGADDGVAVAAVLGVAVDAPKSPLTASDAVSAQVAAKAQGSRVEVLTERTESSQTFANPDGTFTTEAADGIVRVKDSSASDGWREWI